MCACNSLRFWMRSARQQGYPVQLCLAVSGLTQDKMPADGRLTMTPAPSAIAGGAALMLDRFLSEFDRALRAVAGVTRASRPNPADAVVAPATSDDVAKLSESDRRHAAGLMRVNHVGEVCAQALYQGQALFARDPAIRAQLDQAAREEEDHLAWCAQRLQELNDRPSLLNPLWYAGAFTIGAVAGRLGDRISLGFVAETERQVEHHLDGHLDALPDHDTRSRAIVAQMRDDEIRHGDHARQAGGIELPAPIRHAMRAASRVMTTTAYRI